MEDEDLLKSNMKNDVLKRMGDKRANGLVGPRPEKKPTGVFDVSGVPFASVSDKYIAKDPVGERSSKELRDWYENPETMKRLVRQTGLNESQIKEKLLSAYATKTKVTSKMSKNAQGEYLPADWGRKEKSILVGPNAEKGTGFHEKIHATEMDDVLGGELLKVTGKPKGFSDVKKYLSAPGEAYSKFSEFRLNLGLKPGEKIKDAKQLKELAKKKGLDADMFFQAFDTEKIKDAINTIAVTSNKSKKGYV